MRRQRRHGRLRLQRTSAALPATLLSRRFRTCPSKLGRVRFARFVHRHERCSSDCSDDRSDVGGQLRTSAWRRSLAGQQSRQRLDYTSSAAVRRAAGEAHRTVRMTVLRLLYPRSGGTRVQLSSTSLASSASATPSPLLPVSSPSNS
jgi:hypothetical protein